MSKYWILYGNLRYSSPLLLGFFSHPSLHKATVGLPFVLFSISKWSKYWKQFIKFMVGGRFFCVCVVFCCLFAFKPLEPAILSDHHKLLSVLIKLPESSSPPIQFTDNCISQPFGISRPVSCPHVTLGYHRVWSQIQSLLLWWTMTYILSTRREWHDKQNI